ncbi:MAG: ankyrin repeat domain-containing protein [Bacteroidota bacterium]
MATPPLVSVAEPPEVAHGHDLKASPACPNCEAPRAGDYCSQCGHSFRIERLTFRVLFAEFARKFLNFEQGLLRTAKEMTLDPGGVARRYIAGQRRRYVNPFTYLVAGTAVSLLVTKLSGMGDTMLEHVRDQLMSSSGGAENRALVQAQIDASVFMTEHTMYLSILAVIPMALLLRWWLGSEHRHTTAEMTVMPLYVFGHLSLIGTVIVAMVSFFPYDPLRIMVIGMAPGVAYFAWAGYGLFKTKGAAVLTSVIYLFSYVAVIFGSTNVVLVVFLIGANQLGVDTEDWSPSLAAQENAVAVMQAFVDEGVDVNQPSAYTPLHLAARAGHVEMVTFLLDHGGDVNAVDQQGRTPGYLAMHHDQAEVAGLLLKADGARLGLISERGQSLLMEAVNHDFVDLALWLAQQDGVDPNVQHLEDGSTALIQAARKGYVDVVEMLLAQGADPSLADHEGRTAQEVASDEAVKALLQAAP